MEWSRQLVLGVLLLTMATLTAYVLAAILQLIVFAVTVAYVLYPIRDHLGQRGFSPRLASALSTLCAFVSVVALAAPIVFLTYQRRNNLIGALGRVPNKVEIPLADVTYVVKTEPYTAAAVEWIRDIAVSVAVAVPTVVLGLTVFTIVIYGILYRPQAIRTGVVGIVPEAYRDIPERLHAQTRATLYTIYVLQASTALATFAIALVVFLTLGLDAPFSLAVLAGVLQFIPILGPSILIAALAANEFLLGNIGLAVSILIAGLVLISFMPDAIIRTQLANRTADIPSTLYFVGFVGGLLTLGPVGLIVGPLVVALLVETLTLLSEHVPQEVHSTEPSEQDDTPDGVRVD